MTLSSQSNLRCEKYHRTLCSPSIGSRISTCLWCDCRSRKSVIGYLKSDLAVVRSGPSWLVGVSLTGRLVLEVRSHHALCNLDLDVVERLI